MTETMGSILKKIETDLAWRGLSGDNPNGGKLSHIVLSREQAEHAHRVMLEIILERDALVFEKERLTEAIRQGFMSALHSQPSGERKCDGCDTGCPDCADLPWRPRGA